MFSNIKHGWTNIKIGDFIGRGSYLTDIPIDTLNAFINSFKYNIPASIFFDEEGSEFTLVTFYNTTYVIVERDEEPELISINVDADELAKEIIKDIENNLEEWVNWLSYYDSTKSELLDREFLIRNKLNQLKGLID